MPETRMGNYCQLSRFAMVGVLNTIVGVAVIFILYSGFGYGLMVSNAVGYGIGLVLSYVLNGSWTFGSSSYQLTDIGRYAVLVCVAFVVSFLLIERLMSLGLPYWIAQVSGVVAYSVLVFLGMKYAIFTK